MEKEGKQKTYLQAHEVGVRILFPLLRNSTETMFQIGILGSAHPWTNCLAHRDTSIVADPL